MHINESKIILILSKTIFFSSLTYGKKVFANGYLENIFLKDLSFSVRIKSIFKKKQLISLLDLLNYDVKLFEADSTIEEKTIARMKEVITNFLLDASESISIKKMIFFGKENLEKQRSGMKDKKGNVYVPFLEEYIDNKNNVLEKLRKVDISKINFTSRFSNFLDRNPMNKVNDLLETSVSDMFKQNNIGIHTIKSVQETIKKIITDKKEFESVVTHETNILKIIEVAIDRYEGRAKEIILTRWSKPHRVSYSAIVKKELLTTERKRQIAELFTQKLSELLRGEESVFEFFLNQLCKLEPITFNQLEKKFPIEPKYSKIIYVGILSEIFTEVTFAEFEPRSLDVYIFTRDKYKDGYVNFYNKLNEIDLPFGKVTVNNLFEILEASTVSEKLIVLYLVFNSKHFKFIRVNGSSSFLIRRNVVRKMLTDILTGSDEPKRVDELLKTINRYYVDNRKYFIKATLLMNLRESKWFFQFGRDLFGLKKHFPYNSESLNEIKKDILIYFKKTKRQINAIEILELLKPKYPGIKTKYNVLHLLSSCEEIENLGFFNFRLKKRGEGQRLRIKDILLEVFKEDPKPKHYKEIFKKIKERRYVNSSGINVMFHNKPYIKNYKAGYYGLFENHEEHFEYIASNAHYIYNLITNYLFPNTTLKYISEAIDPKGNYEDIIRKNVEKCKGLYLLEDKKSNVSVCFSEKWSPYRIAKCAVINLNRAVTWEELGVIVGKLGKKMDSDNKSLIKNDKCIRIKKDGNLYYSGSSKKDNSSK